jgi:hypothetical protein
LVEDPKWELAILATVQGFYERLLQEPLHGEVPVPAGLEAVSLQQNEGEVQETLSRMRRWLNVLDMAITPAMLRRGFTTDTDPEIAEAMLRYLVRKKDSSDVNRDKTDLVATFLYRHPRVPGQWEQRGYGLDGVLPLSPFEIALIEILAETDPPSLPEEHVQLLRRIDPLQEEAEGFRDFNSLMDSGIIPRVRELKASLDTSFFHPGILATIAPYNSVFGRKFDELFQGAAKEIKSFAEALEEQGGSILGNVDGVDVTVEHVAGLDQRDLLKHDYGTALEKFQRVSKLKKTLDRRPPIRRNPRPVVAPRAVVKPQAGGAAAAASMAPVRRVVMPSVSAQQLQTEESKLRRVEESIRVFVRVADPKFRQVVPMRFFNLMLSQPEVEAYCADYLEEKTLRADVARTLLRMVAVTARITTELEELSRCDNSASLWKLHADSLVVLLEVARSTGQLGARVMNSIAQQGGTQHQSEAVRLSLEKLRHCSETAIRSLSQAEAELPV